MTPHRPASRRSTFRRRLAGFVSGLLLAGASLGTAAAQDDGGDESPEAVQKKIRAQMEKILRLMRENQQALLEASVRGGEKPKGPEVDPPDAPDAPAMEGGTGGQSPPPEGSGQPPPGGSGDGGAGEAGEKAKRAVEELIRTTQTTGGTIPAELETLLRMIPTQGGGGGGGGDPSADAEGRKEMGEQPDPKDERKSPEKDPSDGNPKPGEQPPPEAEKGRSPPDAPPAWWTSLPDSVRQAIVSGRTEDVPPRYRSRIQAYRKWLAEQATRTR